MKAGRELDALVAEQVMGLDVHWSSSNEPLLTVRSAPNAHHHKELPPYGTDIAAAWEVVEKVGGKAYVEMGLRNDAGDGADWCATFGHAEGNTKWIEDGGAFAETAPLAICLAALKAVGAEVPDA